MNCIPLESVPTLVDRVLAEAGASKAIRARAVGIANDIEYAGGQVILVQTDKPMRLIAVRGQLESGASKLVLFKFPPNSPAHEAELIRAQDGGRVVSVIYRPDAKGVNLIESVLVYAGAAAGAPRY
jgi:hypothetical protein